MRKETLISQAQWQRLVVSATWEAEVEDYEHNR